MLSKPPASHPDIPLTRRGLGVTLTSHARNPSQLARALYLAPEAAPHTMFSGAAAEELGKPLGVELVDGLRAAGADGDEVEDGLVERADADGVLLALDLGGEEADAAGHLVDATYFAHEGPLERVHARVELYENQQKLR